MLKKIVAGTYLAAVIGALGWGYARAPEDPASYILAAVCGIPWTFVGSGFAGDFSLIGPVMTVQGILINGGLIWWWALRRPRKNGKKDATGAGLG